MLQTFNSIRWFIEFSEFAEKFKAPLLTHILTALNKQATRKYLGGLLDGVRDIEGAPKEKFTEFLSLGEEFFTALEFHDNEKSKEELEARRLQGYLAGSKFQRSSSLTIERLRDLKLYRLENLDSFITSANKHGLLGKYLNENLTSIEEILQFPEINYSTWAHLKKAQTIESVKKEPSLLAGIININWYRGKGYTVSNLNREQQLSLQLMPVREAVEKGEITFEQAKNIGNVSKYRHILRKRIITPKDFLALEEPQRMHLFSLPTGAIECVPGIISPVEALRLQLHQAVNLALLKVGSMGGYYRDIVSPNIIEECFREGIVTVEQILQVRNEIKTEKLQLLALFINHPGVKEGMRAGLWNLAQIIQAIQPLEQLELNILVECLKRGRQSSEKFNDIIKEILSFSSAPSPLSLLNGKALEVVDRRLLTLAQILTITKALQIQPIYSLRKIIFDRILDNMLSSNPLTYAQIERLLQVEAGVIDMVLNNIANDPQLTAEMNVETWGLEEIIANNTTEYHEQLAREHQRQFEQEDIRAPQQRRQQENRNCHQQFTPALVQQRDVAHKPLVRAGPHLLTADLFQFYTMGGNSHYQLNTQEAIRRGLLTELSEENLCQDFKDIFTKASWVLDKEAIVRNFKITSNGAASIADDRNYIIKPAYTGREHRAMGEEKIWGKIGSLLFCFAPGREGAMKFQCFFIEKIAGNSVKLWPLVYNLDLARSDSMMKFEDYFPLQSTTYDPCMSTASGEYNSLLQRPDQRSHATKIYGIRALFGQAMQCNLNKQAFFKEFAKLYCNTDKFKDFYNYLSDITEGKATAILDEYPAIKIKIMNDIEKYANEQGLKGNQILQKIAYCADTQGREGNFIANLAATYDDQAPECIYLLLKIICRAKGSALATEDIDAGNISMSLDLPNGVEFKWFLDKVNANRPWAEVQRELEAAEAKGTIQAGPSSSSTNNYSAELTTQLKGATLEEPNVKKKKEEGMQF